MGNDKVWQAPALVKTYLEGVRRAVPLAAEQLDLMLRLIEAAQPHPERFLDLGCGDGILGRTILGRFPQAQGTFLDFSEGMLQAAQEKIPPSAQVAFFLQDYGQPDWVEVVKDRGPFEVVISGFSIHHQPDSRKREIYEEIYGLLKPGGLFLNLEHVSSPTPWLESIFEALFVDSLYEFHQAEGSLKPKAQIAQELYNRPDKVANILAPVELQCEWLREIGYEQVDCYLKVLELALFGGIRPPLKG
jgi:ubiquinone/menaquinone biosynthesis C-methylase UbiE